MALDSTATALSRHLAGVQHSYSLQRFNSLGAGGVADFYVEVHDTIELAQAVKAAIDNIIPYLIVGQGTSILFSDGGFPGLIIKNEAKAMAFDNEKSQVVVDSGVPLKQLITAAANQGLGGLTHLYSEPGTVGGAVYANAGPKKMPINSSLRFMTMLMPPAKIDKEAIIARYKYDWLQKEGFASKLQHLKTIRPYQESQPVILTLLFQLTNVRSDEVRLRLQRQVSQDGKEFPRGAYMGPLFLPHDNKPVDSLLIQSNVAGTKIGAVSVDKKYPNYLIVKGGSARSEDIRILLEQIQDSVKTSSGIILRSRYEYLGVW